MGPRVGTASVVSVLGLPLSGREVGKCNLARLGVALLERFLSAIETFTERSGRVVAFGVLLIAFFTMYEVISRFVFNNPTIWAHEMSTLVFSAYAILAGGYVLHHELHVRVDIWFARLSPRRKAMVDLATSIFPLIFLVPLAWFSIPWAWHAVATLERAETNWAPPIYPTKVIIAIGAFWFLTRFIVKFIRDLHTVTREV